MNYTSLATLTSLILLILAVWLLASLLYSRAGLRRPICRKCGADLRRYLTMDKMSLTCGNCTSPLDNADVRFASRRSSLPKGVVAIVSLAAAAWLSWTAFAFFGEKQRRDSGLEAMAYVDSQPYSDREVWDEFVSLAGVSRVAMQYVSRRELAQALQRGEQLLQMEADIRWKRRWVPPTWMAVCEWVRRGYGDDAMIQRVCDLCCRTSVELLSRPVMRCGDKMRVGRTRQTEWKPEDYGPFTLAGVSTLDGRRLPVSRLDYSGKASAAPSLTDQTILCDLPPGEHELVLAFQGELDPTKLRASTTLAGTTRPSAGAALGVKPPPRSVRWTAQFHRKLRVLPATAPVVELITDSTLDPVAAGVVRVPTVVADLDSQKRPVLKVSFPKQGKGTSVVAKLSVVADGHECALGVRRFYANSKVVLGDAVPAALSANVTRVDVVLQPSPESVSGSLPDDPIAIWGKEIRFKDVPVFRQDLPDAK